MRSVIFSFLICSLFLSCKGDESNPSESAYTTFVGEWEFKFSGDLTSNRTIIMESNNNFSAWIDFEYRETYSIYYYSALMKGNVSQNGTMVAVITDPDLILGNLTGILTETNGFGNLSIRFGKLNFKCNWVAFKK